MIFKRLRLKFSVLKVKKLVSLAVNDSKKILEKAHNNKIDEIEMKYMQEQELTKIRYDSNIQTIQTELDAIRKDKSNFQLSYYKTQRLADKLQGAIISLGTIVDDRFDASNHEFQRFKASYSEALKTFKDLSAISLLHPKHEQINQ